MRRDLAGGVSDLNELAERHKVSRVHLARWAGRPRQSAMIDELARLADRRALLLLATARADAALMLKRIALREETDARDVSRKACVDLLKLDRAAAPRGCAASEPSAAPRFSAAELDAAMTDFSRRADLEDADHADEHAAPPDDPSNPSAAD
jgi:hypothetical protein